MPFGSITGRLLGHGWTIGPWLLHEVHPAIAPAAAPWSTVLEDAKIGAVKLTGLLRHQGPSLAILVHGLGGEVEASYMARAAVAAEQAGLSSLRLHLRGADRSGEDYYHAGLTADLHAAIASPDLARYERIFLFGYSLGGHLTLRYAVDAPDPRVVAVAAACSPLDLDASAHAFDQPECELYRRFILRSLYEIYEEVARRRQVPISVALARRIRTIREWDRLIVAPRYGFRDAEHYYHSVSVGPWLPELRIPSLLVYARHDPIVVSSAVSPALQTRAPRTVVRWIERGGHLGFSSKLDLGFGPLLGLEGQIMSW
ncbi:MAG TPA: alpha/beta fold hydrolase, partial [Polyangiaceae bacterium]